MKIDEPYTSCAADSPTGITGFVPYEGKEILQASKHGSRVVMLRAQIYSHWCLRLTYYIQLLFLKSKEKKNTGEMCNIINKSYNW